MPVVGDADIDMGLDLVAGLHPKLAVTASLDAHGFASRLEEMMECRGTRTVIDATPKALGSD